MRISRLMGRLSYPALIVGMLAAPAIGHAAEAIATNAAADEAGSDAGATVKGVTVTAAQHPPLTAAFTEDTIPADTVRNLSPASTTTIQTLLNQEPSMFNYADGPFGMRTTTNFRAFNSGEFSETIDGIELNDAFEGGVTGSASVRNNVILTPANIDSIQVYRGINNPSVNGYDSLGGTVAYASRAPAATFGGEAGVSYGSFDTTIWHALVNTGEVHNVSQLFSVESGSSDGWMTSNDADRNLNLYYAADYKPNEDNKLTARFAYDWNSGYDPMDTPLAATNALGKYWTWPQQLEYERVADNDLLGIVDWTSKLSPIVTLDSKGFASGYDFQRMSYVDPAYNEGKTLPDPGLIPLVGPFAGGEQPYEIYNSSTHADQIYHYYHVRSWSLGYTGSATINLPDNDVIIGANYTYSNLYSAEYFGGTGDFKDVIGLNGNDYWDEQDRRTYASGYIQDDIHVFGDNLHITPGLKYLYAATSDYDAASYYGAAGGVSDVEHFLSPTLGASYKFLNDFSLFASYGENVKFPEISAYYDNTPNNEYIGKTVPLHVRPEFVRDYEYGLRYSHHDTYVTIDGYYEKFTGTFITETDPTTQNATTVNGPPSEYKGLELQIMQDLHNLAYIGGDTHLYVSYAHNKATLDETNGVTAALTGAVNLGDVPQDLLSTGFVWSRQGWRVNVDGRYVGTQYLDNYDTGLPTNSVIHPYFTMNLGVSKTVDVKALNRTNKVRFSLNVDNLLDRYYINEGDVQTTKHLKAAVRRRHPRRAAQCDGLDHGHVLTGQACASSNRRPPRTSAAGAPSSSRRVRAAWRWAGKRTAAFAGDPETARDWRDRRKISRPATPPQDGRIRAAGSGAGPAAPGDRSGRRAGRSCPSWDRPCRCARSARFRPCPGPGHGRARTRR